MHDERVWWIVKFVGIASGIVLLVAAMPSSVVQLIRLPGTQPGQVAPADSFQNCASCHQAIVQDWLGSSKAQATRDPLFNALLSITTKKTLPLGMDSPEFCLRCHSPSAWLAGRSHELSVQYLFGTDLDGVQCDFCHRATDPVFPDSGASISDPVPGYGNGMYVVMPTGTQRRGPRPSTPAGHPTFQEPFLKTSEFCGVCHDVSNPYFSSGPPSLIPPHRQPALERTYSEWKLSWFAAQGEAGTCQACHMPKSQGYAATPGGRLRLDVARHTFNGTNTLVPAMMHEFWSGTDTVALEQGKERSLDMQHRAAALDVVAGRESQATVALVRVTNLTGHKLPTGFSEGRRMWISVTGKDRNGNIVFESGKYDAVTRELVNDTQLKKYEAHLGPTQATASATNTPVDVSFLSALSDSTYFDNRIPPRGFSLSAFREYNAEPRGYVYTDGQYWDVTRYEMPIDVASVNVSLMFQQVTKEFAEYLRDENADNPYDWNAWGERVYAAWQQHGAPVVMAEQHVSVQPSLSDLAPVKGPEIPARFILAQNYPNPFNASTTIEFWLSTAANVKIVLYDIGGREVGRPVDGEMESGLHTSTFSSSQLASGVYLYRLYAGNTVLTKKMVVLR